MQENDPTERLFDEEITESIQNETGVKKIDWGPVRKNINFINAKPALVNTATNESVTKTNRAQFGDERDDEDLSQYSQKGDFDVKPTKKEQMLSELKIALMVKHSDPLKYYGMKQERKLKIHDESYKRLK